MPIAAPVPGLPGLPLWQSTLLLAPAAIALVGASAARSGRRPADVWRSARVASTAMVVASIAALAAHAFGAARAGVLLRSDTVGVAVSVLVSFVGSVVITYSAKYLEGDPFEQRYARRLMVTLAAVSVVVVANDLVLLAAAWLTTSLALHGLLTFFGDRRAAVVAAHKKFLLARAADLCMVGAIAAFVTAFGTLRIDRIVEAATVADPLPVSARIGIAFVAAAALLKCAQLPFHGWLIQVMEAPTPVSALLHAGVVNLGGFVLLRFAGLVDLAIETRTLLVVVGALTAVVASLVMTTRVSIKVSLAWSTCAQMGFMLMQCGLGLWEMALLHLLAHSLYKAHAFLGAGGVVRQTQRKMLVGKRRGPTLGSLAVTVPVAGALVLATGWLWSLLPFAHRPSATLWLMGAITSLAVVPLVPLTTGVGARHGSRLVRAIGPAAAVPMTWFALHELFGRLVPGSATAPAALLVVVGTAFTVLFVLQSVLVVAPRSALVRRLHPWIYGGLFLDERFSRRTFRLWAPPATTSRPTPLPRPSATPLIGLTSSVGRSSADAPLTTRTVEAFA